MCSSDLGGVWDGNKSKGRWTEILEGVETFKKGFIQMNGVLK
jgi:hypothetical protein